MKRFVHKLCFFLFLVNFCQISKAQENSSVVASKDFNVAASCDGIRVLSDELSAQQAQAFCKYASVERKKLKAFWGATWKQPIRIHVDSTYQFSKALTVVFHGRKRGFMEMPTKDALNHTSPLLHEMTHIYAPDENRFLAEGLGIYLQERFGQSKQVFPTLGKDLTALARASLSSISFLTKLNLVVTPAPLGVVVDIRTAYILAGSFVGFLIEHYGLNRFKKLLKQEFESFKKLGKYSEKELKNFIAKQLSNYRDVYGKPLETI